MLNLIYKKLFEIKYNNKKFAIFIDENNRRTFLEINEKGNYVYPTEEDFLYLNNVYNNSNPFLVDVTNYTFKEKVKRVAYGTLATIVVLNSSKMILKKYIPKISDNKLEIFQSSILSNKKEIIEIKDLKQLDDLLGYEKVSISEIHSVIDFNDDIERDYKYLVHNFLDNLTSKYSNLDLRIFYENIKSIKIEIVSSDYFNNIDEKNVCGRYNANLNQIILLDSFTEEDFIHELSHTIDLYYRENDKRVIYRAPIGKGMVLNEAMTNVTASCTLQQQSYDKYGAILEYLRNSVNYDYYTYNQKGIWYLFELLYEKYPEVDIDYIVCTLDTMNITEKNGQYIYLDSSPDLLKELFKICIIEFNKNQETSYNLFKEFIGILHYTLDWKLQDSSIIPYYLEKYNQLLIEKNSDLNLITGEDVLDFYQEKYMSEMFSNVDKKR